MWSLTRIQHSYRNNDFHATIHTYPTPCLSDIRDLMLLAHYFIILIGTQRPSGWAGLRSYSDPALSCKMRVPEFFSAGTRYRLLFPRKVQAYSDAEVRTELQTGRHRARQGMVDNWTCRAGKNTYGDYFIFYCLLHRCRRELQYCVYAKMRCGSDAGTRRCGRDGPASYGHRTSYLLHYCLLAYETPEVIS